jgi:hypothetical protein
MSQGTMAEIPIADSSRLAMALRRHDLDSLRAFAILLGIALHAGMSLTSFPWAVPRFFPS